MKPTPEQRRVLDSSSMRVLVLAGPGTGKTFTLASSALHWSPNGRVLILTLTNYAANQVRSSLGALSRDSCFLREAGIKPPALELIEITTMHSFALRTLQRRHSQLGEISDDAIEEELLASIASKKAPGFAKNPQLLRALLKIYKSGPSTWSSGLRKMGTRISPHEAREILAALDSRKAEMQILTFNDILVRFHTLLQDPRVREELQALYPFIMVDEFQDTAALPWRILQRLAGPRTRLLVAGDDGQTIFTYAGASFKRARDFLSRYPNAETHVLTLNHRSTAQLQALSDALLRQSRYVGPQEIRAPRNGPRPLIACCGDMVRASEYVVRQIQGKGLPLDSMAVLYRHIHDAAVLRDDLQRSGIPYVIFGDKSMRHRPYARLIFAIGEIVESPMPREEAWREILQYLPGVGEARLAEILAWLKGKQRQETGFPRELRFRDPLKKFLEFVDSQRGSSPMQALLATVDYVDTLPKVNRSVKPFILPTLAKMVQDTSLMDARKLFFDYSYPLYYPHTTRPPFPDTYLTLSTIHGSKGGEYETVFYLGGKNDLYVKYGSLSSTQKREAELQVLRVAVTRPRSDLRLVLPIPKETLMQDRAACNPWKFLRNCPKKIFQIL